MLLPLPRFIRLAALSLFAAGAIGAPAFASEVSRRLDRLVQNLARDYQAKRPDRSKQSVPLAILDLNTGKKLAEKRVGFAVAELLTQKFVKTQGFDVVERAQLEKVLAEQRLQLTGVTNESAVRIGQTLGAKLLLLGSVEELANDYQVNARLVEVENGQVVAAGFEELDADHFEQEARSYLDLVPKVQVIGLYASAGFSPARSEAQPAFSYSGTIASATYVQSVSPREVNPAGTPVGVGVRYSPLQLLTLDVAYFPKGPFSASGNAADLSGGGTGVSNSIATGSGFTQGPQLNLDLKSTEYRVGAAWTPRILKSLRAFLGGGAAIQQVEATLPSFTITSLAGTAQSMLQGAAVSESKTLVTPFVRAGAEWRPQARLGIGFFGYLAVRRSDLTLNQRVTQTEIIYGQPSRVTVDEIRPIYKLQSPLSFFEATLSFYF